MKLQTEAWPDKFGSTYYRTGSDDDGIPYRYQSIEDYRNVKGVDWQNENVPSHLVAGPQRFDLGRQRQDQVRFLSFADFLENGIFKNSAFNKVTAKMRVSP